MKVLSGALIKEMTGCAYAKDQADWFAKRGYTFESDKYGKIWTTDDWMNGKDKLRQVSNDEGFDLGALG
jgi:hypothetical protein|tara:strand:- start:1252 stop:1458 length:207 start_codon:yes stop_codon:yes gene_type:complete